ncbi:alpha/beta fold hydrolase [Agromyces sp. Soil535]|uniref:alpha/beta fold hydrolase n=1 Tax=Agromyces sp. Soil535 TaxID=1736390 RepID=UPI000714DCD1|nr:alpha/beta hydrolase [Agromyces sp. Soil535]KRE29967.1 hypothetical protein ASG80_18730 [Agromyces sp. Soil535]
MATIATRLSDLSVETVGAGPPCVLWHGLFVDSRIWDRVRDELAGRRTLVIIDGPSAGRSDPLTRRASVAECAMAAIEVLDGLGIEGPVDWIGLTWGGHVGIALAADHPGRIRSPAAIGSPTHRLGTRGGSERWKVQLLCLLYGVLGPIPPVTGALLGSLLTDHTRATDEEACTIVREGFTGPPRRATVLAARSFALDRPDLTGAAERIAAPVLFLATTERGEWTPQLAQLVADEMLDARVQAVAGLGIPPLESPDETVDAVTSFWSALPDAWAIGAGQAATRVCASRIVYE